MQGAGDLAAGDGLFVADFLFHLAQAHRAVEGAREGDGVGGAGAHRQADQPGLTTLGARLGDGGVKGHAGLDVNRVHRRGQGFDCLAGFVARHAGALDGRFKCLARPDLDRDVLRPREAGLGFGLGEGGRLEGRTGGRVEGRLDGRSGSAGGHFPADGQRGDTGDTEQQAGSKPKCRASWIKLLHRAPVLAMPMVKLRQAYP